MTDETDITSEDADSGRGVEEKVEAQIIAQSPPDDPQVYLVEYPDGSQMYEPSTPTNRTLFETNLYGRIQGHNVYSIRIGDETVDVELDADIANKQYTIAVDGNPLPVPSNRIEDVLDAFDTDENGAVVGSKLYSLYEDILDGQVRRHVVEQFLDRFPNERVEQTPDGWVVDDTFVVTYEGENHLLDLDPVDPYSGDVDESKQAVYLDVDANQNRTVTAPSGDTIELEPIEQEFLTMVEGLLYPDNYFGVELVEEIEQHKAESEMLDDVIEDLTEQADVTGFTDARSGIHHGSTDHGFDKHCLSDLGVTNETADLLWASDYDHAGPWEMYMRKDELINRPDIDVFVDADDDDPSKWDKIKRTKENAPIPDRVQQTLKDMYGE